MADYSHLNGSVLVTPSATRIWEIQKKRKTGERQRQNGKNPAKKEKQEDNELKEDVAVKDEKSDNSSSRWVKKTSHKIDMKI